MSCIVYCSCLIVNFSLFGGHASSPASFLRSSWRTAQSHVQHYCSQNFLLRGSQVALSWVWYSLVGYIQRSSSPRRRCPITSWSNGPSNDVFFAAKRLLQLELLWPIRSVRTRCFDPKKFCIHPRSRTLIMSRGSTSSVRLQLCCCSMSCIWCVASGCMPFAKTRALGFSQFSVLLFCNSAISSLLLLLYSKEKCSQMIAWASLLLQRVAGEKV